MTMNQSDTALFDSLMTEKLGHYVYVLIDPETGHPFYVGKGGGRSGAGNRRLVDHFAQARNQGGTERDKIERIRAIWQKGRDVPWKIIRSGLASEDEAFLVEAALIDTLRDMKVVLTNEQSGHGSRESGLKSPDDLRAWCATELNFSTLPDSVIGRPIFIFNIKNGVAERRAKAAFDDPRLIDEATRQFWNVTPQFRSLPNAIAIGCIDGISRAVVPIAGWQQAGETRWEIIAADRTHETPERDALCFKNFRPILNHVNGAWQRGSYAIVRIKRPRTLVVLRGKGDKTPIAL